MHAFDVLGDPVRRRILELLPKEHSSGDIVLVVQRELASHNQPSRSNFESSVKADLLRADRRVAPHLFRRPGPLRDIDDWLNKFKMLWAPRLDAWLLNCARQAEASQIETCVLGLPKHS